MKKEQSKSKWKVPFFVLLGLVVWFIIWALTDDSEETTDASTTQEETESVATVSDDETFTSAEALLENGAIREQQVVLKGDGTDTVTILMYMNGSNLETDDQEATTDLSEMVAAGSSDQVNFLVQTMGTKKWSSKYGIASDRSQIYSVDGNGLTLVKDDLGQKDCTKASTLADFIKWGKANYPADRYILLLWDHGGGPVYGYGYDEWNSDENAALTIDEMQSALKDGGVYFDFVGMDCCLMSCLEVCCAFYEYCDYMVLSEDFESGLGWSYTNWLRSLYENTSISTVDLGKKICDEMISANESDSEGDKSIMAVIDQSMLKVLFTTWVDFAYANEDQLLNKNYSRKTTRKRGGRILPAIQRHREKGWDYDFWADDDSEENLDMAEYYVTDIMEVASSISSDKSSALTSAIDKTLCYVTKTSTDDDLTGIAISLPYGDSEYYGKLKTIFGNVGIDSDYITWLGKFVDAEGTSDYYDYEDWDNSWDGWDSYEDDYNWDDWDYNSCGSDYWEDDWSYYDYDDYCQSGGCSNSGSYDDYDNYDYYEEENYNYNYNENNNYNSNEEYYYEEDDWSFWDFFGEW